MESAANGSFFARRNPLSWMPMLEVLWPMERIIAYAGEDNVARTVTVAPGMGRRVPFSTACWRMTARAGRVLLSRFPDGPPTSPITILPGFG